MPIINELNIMISVFLELYLSLSKSLSFAKNSNKPYAIVAIPRTIIISPAINDLFNDVTLSLTSMCKNISNFAITNPKPIKAIPVLIHAKNVLLFAK